MKERAPEALAFFAEQQPAHFVVVAANGSRECATDDRRREAFQRTRTRLDCFAPCARLRKRFAFVAGNDNRVGLIS
jgi:hypothetical protein